MNKAWILIGIAVAVAAPAALAQDYPTKPIRIIVSYAPGGGTDVIARVLARKLNEAWGQAVIVENRPGAGGNIGTEAVAKAAPDGYTLSLVPSSHAIAPLFYAKLPFDVFKDFTFITLVASGPNIVVVNPSVPVKSIAELVSLAKEKPDELAFASAGVGSSTHLAGEYFNGVAGIKALHVPYKGSSQAEADVISGRVSYMVDSIPSALPKVQAGQVRALATTGKRRFAALPNVPTALEAGIPYESTSWWGVIGPANLPSTIVDRIGAEITRILRQDDVKEFIAGQGAEPTTSTPQEFFDLVKRDNALYAKIVKDANIRIEQ
ncbi:MAG TPA: tripartite tricarboxylate transporter substrate binding protein [Casimicrobiaceae bacterium]|jgi:tripartite-type tricarboxylate transporter receptor subunit TctC